MSLCSAKTWRGCPSPTPLPLNVTVATQFFHSRLGCYTNATLTFVCTLEPLASKSALGSVIAKTTLSTAIVSTVTGNPMAAIAATQVVSMLSLRECFFSDVDPLDETVSPFVWAVGERLGGYYRGSVVGALLLRAALLVGGACAVFGFPRCLNSPVLPCTPSGIASLLRLPSLYLPLVAITSQGLFECGVSLLRISFLSSEADYTSASLDAFLGFAALLCTTAEAVFFILHGSRWLMRCKQVPRPKEEPQEEKGEAEKGVTGEAPQRGSVSRLSAFWAAVTRFAVWTHHWEDDGKPEKKGRDAGAKGAKAADVEERAGGENDEDQG